MLTARQMVSIATQKSQPPLHLSSLAKTYKVSPFSLRVIENLMHRQKAYFLCEARDISIMKTVKSYAELRNVWASSKPSKATLEQLASILGASGASVKVVSELWRKVGIAGNVGGLASISALKTSRL